MAFMSLSCPILLLLTLTLLSSGALSGGHRHRHHHRRPFAGVAFRFPSQTPASHFHSALTLPSTSHHGGGSWSLLQSSVGVSAMHMQLLHDNTVVIFDRTDFGPSNLSLPAGKCRPKDEALPIDCSAHSILYDVAANTYRPLAVETNVWCSSGAVNSNGTLIQTGGYHTGNRKIRTFTPCSAAAAANCDWIELHTNLTVQRWYASDQILPDDRVIIVGGRRAFSYEFFPKQSNFVGGSNSSGEYDSAFYFPFLKETTDPKEENNLYPFLHLLPDGNLFVFANQRSISLDYRKNRVIREFPAIPGEKRTYPATGSSVMLPLILSPTADPSVEIMICGGARGGAYLNASRGIYVAASKSCGRIRVTDPNPIWKMEDMPMGRVMPDMLLLPTGDVIILNGAGRGSAGWESAVDPILNPLLYHPYEPDRAARFDVLRPTTIPRMYHSSAILLPDGRILVGGSNPHVRYNFTGVKYPTELSLEAFSPPYLATALAGLRPSIIAVEGTISYGQRFEVTFAMGILWPAGECVVTAAAPSFTTHSFAMNQRLLVLRAVCVDQLSAFAYRVTVESPAGGNIAPPGYYMLFVVFRGVPSEGVWVRFG
ncbi:glyoxal oxidase-related protein [Striga hermonthica]|uniref:Glyoxal oxidase-related protein n=1 Tax=Striga hermonthica TaxID=68872 RepID=A0A9N7NN92_STRHE|nr:glyoxal oxidase-related protein [Striga hermonthica]